MCLLAIKRKPSVIKYIINQTEYLCYEAIKRDGTLLPYIQNQTKKIRRQAIYSNILNKVTIAKK